MVLWRVLRQVFKSLSHLEERGAPHHQVATVLIGPRILILIVVWCVYVCVAFPFLLVGMT